MTAAVLGLKVDGGPKVPVVADSKVAKARVVVLDVALLEQALSAAAKATHTAADRRMRLPPKFMG